jgi:hypothetical protein
LALPLRAAVMSGVSPDERAMFGLAPAARRRSIIGALPLRADSQSGVAPSSFTALTRAPDRIKRSAVSRLLRWTAQ